MNFLSTIIVALISIPTVIFANEVRGPSVAIEEAQPAKVSIETPEADKSLDIKIRRRRIESYFIAPVPTLSDVLFAKVDFFQERRTVTQTVSSTSRSVVDSPSALGLGLVYLHPKAQNGPQYFGVVERYGYPRLKDTAQMMEYVIAADYDNDSAPWSLKLNDSDTTKSRILVRLRQFPGYQHWLFLVAHKIDTASGWIFDASLPVHLIVGWQNSDASWKYYGGVRYNGREYPLNYAGKKVWAEGFTSTAFLAVRKSLFKPLFVALEAGLQKEQLIYRDDQEHKLHSFETKNSPWARLALETWVQR